MIQVTGLTKAYRRGRPPAVLDLTFDVRPGTVTALLGDEGAGKSTALRLMVELERGHGVTLFGGRTYRRIRHPEREIGVLLPTARPEAGHPGLRARAHLRMLAGAVGVPAKRADDLLEQTRLAAVADQRIGTFSPGMHRRLALAAALLGTPSTLLLDAPTEGLSPRNEEWFHAFLRSFAVAGGTVLTATRSPEEAVALADRVITLDRGRLAADQPVVEFRRTRLHPEVLVRGPQMARLADLLVSQGGQVRRNGGAGIAVSGVGRTEIGELAYRHGILLHELADRVVERPLSYPSALPAGSGRSGQAAVRTVRQATGEEAPTGPSAPRTAAVGRPAGPEHERPLDHRGLQAGRWAAAALAPPPAAPARETPTRTALAAPSTGIPAREQSTSVASSLVEVDRPGPGPADPVRGRVVPSPVTVADVQSISIPEASVQAVSPAPGSGDPVCEQAPAPSVDLVRRAPRGSSALGRGAVPAPAGFDAGQAEQLAANPTDAELLAPARIGGPDGPGGAPARPGPAAGGELRPAVRAERTRPEPGGGTEPVRRRTGGDESGSE